MSLTTVKELLEVHNHLAEGLGKPTLRSWSKAKGLLQERIDAMRAEHAPKAKRQSGTGKASVKTFIETMIHDGHDNAVILKACEAEFSDLDWTGNRKTYPGWYRANLKRQAKKRA